MKNESQILDKSIQKEVQSILGWTAQQWAEFVEQCGNDYLNVLMPEYPQVVSQITRSSIFWNWWRSHWERRDIEYLEQIDLADDRKIIDVLAEYNEMHNPDILAQALYLNGQILQESYAAMMQKILDAQNKKLVV
ncbi:MAG: hypothetical protein IT249_19965 [Chitinophagaceae bacterium]|nr:hypothetical protein [Chitinophagaceae bacterium]